MNESWHSSYNTSGDRIRAVENGFTLIRCSSDGVSAVVSPRSFFHSLSITLSLSVSRSQTLAQKNTRAHVRVHCLFFSYTHTYSLFHFHPSSSSFTHTKRRMSLCLARTHARFLLVPVCSLANLLTHVHALALAPFLSHTRTSTKTHTYSLFLSLFPSHFLSNSGEILAQTLNTAGPQVILWPTIVVSPHVFTLYPYIGMSLSSVSLFLISCYLSSTHTHYCIYTYTNEGTCFC